MCPPCLSVCLYARLLFYHNSGIRGFLCCATMGPHITLVQELSKVIYDIVAQTWPEIELVQEWPKM
jgi:hypothetical protein